MPYTRQDLVYHCESKGRSREARLVPRETGFIEVDGTRLAYDVEGEGDALLLIHGGLAHRAMWDDQMEDFARHYRTIRFDMRGFGDSPSGTRPFSFTADVGAVLDGLGVDGAHVLGLSFGARVALDFALAYPHRVRSLILAAPALGGHPFSDATSARIGEADEALERGDIARGVELELRLWIDGPHRTAAAVDRAVRERTRAMNTHNYEHGADEADPFFPAPPAAKRLGEIGVPVLIIVGDSDVEDIGTIADVLETGIRRTSRVVLPDSAHHPNMERPREFNRAVLDFLSALS